MPQSNLEDYKKYNLDKAVLYYPKKLEKERKTITISVSKLFRWKKLTIEGY
ncbi:MAG: hypothetical protein JJT76_17065 [Clostridiaceae bacterium]|nr:hypothetical protein [Clostridiaceae bacterium]